MLLAVLLCAAPALADETAATDGAWTGTAVLKHGDAEQEATFTFSAVDGLAAFDYQVHGQGTQTCRYVARLSGARGPISPVPRTVTAAQPACAEKPFLSGRPAHGNVMFTTGKDITLLKLHHRFKKPGPDAAETTFGFDILDLSPGLDAPTTRIRLNQAGFERKGSRVLSGPGWREEHVTYTRTSEGGEHDQLQIVYSPEIEGGDADLRIVYIQRLWLMAGKHTISDLQLSVVGKYGLPLIRVGNDFAQDRHTTRAGEDIDLLNWNAGCAQTILQQIPFVKAFSNTPERALVSASCGKALTISARPLTPDGDKIASFFVSLTDVDQIWHAAWEKWRVTTHRDIEAALSEVEREGKPVKL